ncbi:MAG: hypothetical protein R2932_37765 [Caldilineaceae bacterium]
METPIKRASQARCHLFDRETVLMRAAAITQRQRNAIQPAANVGHGSGIAA